MKKLLTVFLAAAIFTTLVVGFVGCAPTKEPIVIGISQIVEHPALDAVRKGFIDYLDENGYKEGKDVKYDVNIAQGDMSTAKLIADKLVGLNPNLILTIATPTSQVMIEATSEIPILFSAVTDPVGAGLVESLEGGGKNVSGTTDLSPVDSQFELIMEVIPDIKKLGFIYNAGEANSLTSLKQAKEEAKRLGFEIVEATASNSGEVLSAAESLVGKVDAIHIPTDNTVVSAFESVTKVCKDNDIPLFAADVDSVPRGAVAAIAIDYYRLGRQTGRMAVEILEGKDPGTMPTESLEDLLLYVNPAAAEEMGIELPKDLVDRADKVVE